VTDMLRVNIMREIEGKNSVTPERYEIITLPGLIQSLVAVRLCIFNIRRKTAKGLLSIRADFVRLEQASDER
jgi:hypothetical protein